MVPKAFSLSIHGLEWLQELLVSLLAFELISADLSFFASRKILSKFVQIPGVPSIGHLILRALEHMRLACYVLLNL